MLGHKREWRFVGGVVGMLGFILPALASAGEPGAASAPSEQRTAPEAAVDQTTSNQSATGQVEAAERAFARSMAARDLQAFAGFLSEEAVFFTSTTALRGKQQVVDFWAKFFVEPAPPFAWEPDQVEVLDSGKLAWSSGPVYGPDGSPIARFNSVWRLESPGVWRIVFDKGSPLSPPASPAAEPPSAAADQE